MTYKPRHARPKTRKEKYDYEHYFMPRPRIKKGGELEKRIREYQKDNSLSALINNLLKIFFRIKDD